MLPSTGTARGSPRPSQSFSESFRDRLLTWRHSGFSVYGAQVVLPEETRRIAHVARYASPSDALVAERVP